MAHRDGSEGPLLYGHRGCPRLHAENTLPALQRAIAVGADVLEIDVHMTADGHVVVAHDPDGSRMARVDRRIRETSLSELQCWNVARGFDGGEAPASIPTLDAVLSALPTTRLNIDVKQSEPDMVGSLLELLRAHGAADRVLLTSFDHRTLARIRDAGYGGETGCSQREAIAAAFLPRPLLPGPFVRGQRMQIPTSHFGVDLGSRRFVERFHGLGLAVDYWVVNDVEHARRLLDLGADGIVTDVPEVMAPLFASHPRTDGYRNRHPE